MEVFVNTFLQQSFFAKIVVWEKKSWFTNRCPFGKMVDDFRVLDHLPEVEMVKSPIISESKTGHLSVLFATLEPKLFLSKILEYGHYGKPCKIEIGTGKTDDPFSFKHGCDLSFLESTVFKNYRRIFTFSHDAQFLYEIFR